MTMIKLRFFVGAIMLAALAAFPVLSQEAGELSFFITSAGPGDGANLGGAGRGRPALHDAGSSRRRRREDVARLSEHVRPGRRERPRTASDRARGPTPRGCRSPPTLTSCTTRTLV